MSIIQQNKTISPAIFLSPIFHCFFRNFFCIPKITIYSIIHKANKSIRNMIQTSYTIERVGRYHMVCRIIKQKNKPFKSLIQQGLWPFFIDRSKVTKNLMHSQNNLFTSQQSNNPSRDRSSIRTCMHKIDRKSTTNLPSKPYSRKKKRKSPFSCSIYSNTIQGFING